MVVYICTKFHENILNCIRVMERTRKVNGRTDRQTDGQRARHKMTRLDGRTKNILDGFKVIGRTQFS